MEMSDKKTKVECRLNTRGTDKVNAKVVDDLTIPDPEPTTGKKIIEELMEKETEDGSKSTTP
jgi:hypothetical protein